MVARVRAVGTCSVPRVSSLLVLAALRLLHSWAGGCLEGRAWCLAAEKTPQSPAGSGSLQRGEDPGRQAQAFACFHRGSTTESNTNPVPL